MPSRWSLLLLLPLAACGSERTPSVDTPAQAGGSGSGSGNGNGNATGGDSAHAGGDNYPKPSESADEELLYDFGTNPPANSTPRATGSSSNANSPAPSLKFWSLIPSGRFLRNALAADDDYVYWAQQSVAQPEQIGRIRKDAPALAEP